MKNKENGYWILELNEESIEHALTGTLEIEKEAKLCMVSDGFSQYYDTLKIARDSNEFIDIASKSNLEEMVKKLRNIQEKDSFCNTYPRFKKGDDSTIVYLEIKI